MAFVPSNRYDLFVSYAHLDNIPPEQSGQGWVDALFKTFEISLDMKLGRPGLAAIWRDRQDLRGNQAVTGHIDDQVRQSTLLMLVLSPAYLASQSCLRELRAFVERHETSRIFVVWKDPTERPEQPIPAEIQDLRKYTFWFRDDYHKIRTLGWPRANSPEDRRYYYPMITDLAADVADALERLRAEMVNSMPAGRPASVPRSVPANLPKGEVLLAEVTDDLGPRRDEVSRYLALEGINVLPLAGYRLARIEFEKAFKADLLRCRAFVQILGPYTGKAPPDVPEGFGRLQLDLARDHGVPILQWRSPELDMNQVSAFAHRALLESESVQAVPIEEFKRAIIDLFVVPPPARPIGLPFLFVNAADNDMQSASELVSNLDKSLEWTMPLYAPSDTAEEVQNVAARNLVDSDAVVFFYGQANPRWVLGQLDLYRKLKPQRARDPKLLALVTAPPEPKVPIPIRLQGLKVLSYAEAVAYIQRSLAC